MTGVATSDDVEKIRQQVVNLQTEMDSREIGLRDTLTCIKVNRLKIAAILNKTNELVGVLAVYHDEINVLEGTLRDVQREQWLLGLRVELENSLSFLEIVSVDIQRYDSRFAHQRDLAEIGHLTESLVGCETLVKVLRAIRSDLTSDYLYKNFNARIMKISEASFGFWVSVPQLVNDAFATWSLGTVPFLYNGVARQLQLVNSEIGISMNTGKIISLEKCMYNDPRVCPVPVKYDQDRCMLGILGNNPSQMANCPLQSVRDTGKIEKLGIGALLLYTPGETLQERCLHEPMTSENLSPGAHVVTPGLHCVLASSLKWKYSTLSLSRYSVNISDLYVLPNVSVPFTVPSAPTTASMVGLKEVEKLMFDQQAALPELTKMHAVQVYDTTGSSMGLIASLMVCIVLIILLSWKCRQQCKNRQNKVTTQSTEETVEQTAPVVSSGGGCTPTIPTSTVLAPTKLTLSLSQLEELS